MLFCRISFYGNFVECHFVECHFVECHFVECHYVESHFVEHYCVNRPFAKCHFCGMPLGCLSLGRVSQRQKKHRLINDPP